MLLDRFREAKAEEIALLTGPGVPPGTAAPLEGAQAGFSEGDCRRHPPGSPWP